MLTDLSFLKEGEVFPPDSEEQRIETYEKNRQLFRGDHVSVYAEDLKRIERVIGNFDQVISYPVVINYQKLISVKTADLLLGEYPEIGSEEEAKAKAIKAIVANSNLRKTTYDAAIDISRYGDGLLKVCKIGDVGVIDLTQPRFWFPVVSPDNVRQIVNHVLAWPVGERLKVNIHSKGSYEEREYQFSNGYIGKVISVGKIVKTGLDDFAIVQISNTGSSDSCFGMDDYTDIDSIVADIMVRVGQIDRILDKHASPSVSGPLTALEHDAKTGEWRFKAGNYFPREGRDDPDVNYITWDGQLDANFKQIERLVNLLYTISEMGSTVFGDMTSSNGTVPSGSALKRLMISPLAKVQRIRMNFDPALREAIALCSQLGGKGIVKLVPDDIMIKWQDGIPADDKEQAEIMAGRTGGKATISQKSAIMILDGKNEDDAELELEAIQEDEMNSNPTMGPEIGGDGVPTPEEEEEE